MENFITEIEPLLPEYGKDKLAERCITLLSLAGGLGVNLNKDILKEISGLVINMNSYYSNLIEGNRTTPLEIEKAMSERFSEDPALRGKEYEHIAHIKVQKKIDKLLLDDKNFDICTIEFIRNIHKEFYENIPEEYRIIKDPNGNPFSIIPGKFREFDVIVGRHIPPSSKHIVDFLNKFCAKYATDKLSGTDRLIAAAASHHRLEWIHPFPDGNGRTARLFTHAYLLKSGVSNNDLWSISRGFARNREKYYAMLSNADEKRLNDYDGRGNLSDKRLYEFCMYFLELAIDQVEFMSNLFDFTNLFDRIRKYIENETDLKPASFTILKEALIYGKLRRGDIPKLTGMPERTARRELKKLLDKGLLKSDTPKSAVKPAFPAEILEFYFPRLYPIN